MMAAQSPISGHHHQAKSGRKPLQPNNSSPTSFVTKLKPNLSPADWSKVDRNNKENVHPIYSTPVKESFQIESFDASLAEELSAIREKLERLRVDKEKTDKMLTERALLLDSHMKEINDRGVIQKQLEIEVDRLFRLKEIKLSCTIVSSIRSLREKEQIKKTSIQQQKDQDQDQSKAENHIEIKDDRKEESPLQMKNL